MWMRVQTAPGFQRTAPALLFDCTSALWVHAASMDEEYASKRLCEHCSAFGQSVGEILLAWTILCVALGRTTAAVGVAWRSPALDGAGVPLWARAFQSLLHLERFR